MSIDPRPEWAPLTMALYAGLIRERVHFAQASYRDGEWYCMLGFPGGNCNGEQYAPELGAALRRTLLEPVGQLCIFWWPHDSKGIRAREGALRWLAKHRPPVHWLPDRPIGRANEQGELRPFLLAARTRPVTIVGPHHLAGLGELLGGEHPVQHVEVPDAVAWQSEQVLCEQIAAVARPDELVLFCAGMASCLMIHRLWGGPLRGRATLLDIGAVLDPYAGVLSRGEYQHAGWPALMERNLP